MPLENRTAPDGCAILAVTNHPRHPGVEVEIIVPLGEYLGKKTVDVTHVGAFPAKQVFGDWRETSHQVLSSATQTSWAGGGQIREAAESEDLDRFTGIASLETRFPNHLMLLPLTVTVAGPNATGPRVLGDLYVGGDHETYVAFGTALRRVDGAFPDTLSLSGSWTLTDAPVNGAGACAVFPISGERNLFIPQGAGNGYQTFDGTNLDAQVTTIKPIWFMTHSNKLWALDDAGVLWKSLDGVNWTQAIALDPGSLPRGVIPFEDRYDTPAPHIVTDDGVYAVDEGVPALYKTQVRYAPHPYAGLAFETWRTDLYTAIGLGVQRYTQGTVNAAGLDRDDGPGIIGYISSLRGAFNDLFAGVSPVAQAGVVEDVTVDQGQEVYVGSVQDTAAVMRLTGGQSWHTAWLAPSPGGTVNDLHVSRGHGDYRLLWGWNGLLHVMRLTTDFDNPKHNPESLFMPGGQLIGAWKDFNMPADRMTLAAIETRAGEDFASGDEYDIDYQLDDDDVSETWRPLTTVESAGFHRLRLGANGLYPDGRTRYDGVGFNRYRERITMRRDPAVRTNSPEMKSITEVFRRRMRRVRNFAFVADCSSPENDAPYGLANDERRKVLQELIESETFVPLLYGKEWVSVQLTIAQGREGTALDSTGDVQISALEAWETSG